MLGRVAFLNPATRTGLIFGTDRTRYTFALEDWHDAMLPSRNQDVSFLVQDGRVTIVKPVGEDMVLTEEPMAEAEPPRQRGARAGTPTVAIQAIEAFRGQMDYGASDAGGGAQEAGDADYAGHELDHGEAFPEMLDDDETEIHPGMERLSLTQASSRSSRYGWKPYAIGVGAATLVTAIAAVAIHL